MFDPITIGFGVSITAALAAVGGVSYKLHDLMIELEHAHGEVMSSKEKAKIAEAEARKAKEEAKNSFDAARDAETKAKQAKAKACEAQANAEDANRRLSESKMKAEEEMRRAKQAEKKAEAERQIAEYAKLELENAKTLALEARKIALEERKKATEAIAKANEYATSAKLLLEKSIEQENKYKELEKLVEIEAANALEVLEEKTALAKLNESLSKKVIQLENFLKLSLIQNPFVPTSLIPNKNTTKDQAVLDRKALENLSTSSDSIEAGLPNIVNNLFSFFSKETPEKNANISTSGSKVVASNQEAQGAKRYA